MELAAVASTQTRYVVFGHMMATSGRNGDIWRRTSPVNPLFTVMFANPDPTTVEGERVMSPGGLAQRLVAVSSSPASTSILMTPSLRILAAFGCTTGDGHDKASTGSARQPIIIAATIKVDDALDVRVAMLRYNVDNGLCTNRPENEPRPETGNLSGESQL
jgi:hypothetical protein